MALFARACMECSHPDHVGWLSFSHLAKQTKGCVAVGSCVNSATMNSAVWEQYNVHRVCGRVVLGLFFVNRLQKC
jgi:hypothetical protein